MKRFRDPRIILLLIVSFALLSAELERVIPHSLKHTLKNGQPVNILLLGVDARPGETTARSDTIILASVDSSLKKAVLVWIPRDTRIYTSSRSKKINMVNQLKGPKATCREVEKLMAVPVNHYIVTNFTGFERIIDLLGGVYMDVDINLSSPYSGVYLKKGYHLLNGKEALKYVRYRGRIDGDIGRTQRQQRLLQALSKQLLKKETIPKIPSLIKELQNNFYSNISMSDMLYLANIVLRINESNIVTQTLPGYAYTDPYSGASYWEVDRQTSACLLQSLFHGDTFDVDIRNPEK
jgi:LCP family protein required for cell wall assembly